MSPVMNAELDLRQTLQTRRMLDVAGHYARPDVFQLTLNQRSSPMITTADISRVVNAT